MDEVVYITNDVEAAGKRLGIDSTLSLGSCVVSRDQLTFNESEKMGLVFYAEIRPQSLSHEVDAMRVGCSHLICLEGLRKKNPRFDPGSPKFDPIVVLKHMQKVCEDPRLAMQRFIDWIEGIRNKRKVMGVVDTVFFDSGYINLCLGQNSEKPSPFGWTGLDLDSLYAGYTGRPDAKLRELGVIDDRLKPHRADYDAVFLAKIARKLLFETMGW